MSSKGCYEEGYIDDVLLKLIWKKTGIVFLKTGDEIHKIVPDNLRVMTTMIDGLLDMEEPGEDNNVYINNIEKFKEMFVTFILNDLLSKKYQSIFEKFTNITIEHKNKLLIKSICSLFEKPEKSGVYTNTVTVIGMKQEESYRNIKIGKNRIIDILSKEIENSLNVNIGDVIFVLNYLQDYFSDIETEKFVFSIKTMYSIYLTKLIYSLNFDDVRKIIGGNIYNIDIKRLIKNNYDDCRFVIYNPSKKVENNITSIKDSIIETNKYERYKELESQKSLKDKHLLEWLSYFIIDIGHIPEFNFVQIFNKGFEEYKTEIDTHYEFEIKSIIHSDFIMNKIAFIANLLENRNDENYSCFSEYINEWRTKYKCLLPIYSIEFIEEFINNIGSVYKKIKRKQEDTFEFFVKAIIECVKNIFSKNAEIYSEDEVNIFISAIEECPLIKCLLVPEKYKINFTIDDVEALWYPENQKIAISQTEKKEITEIKKVFDANSECTKEDVVSSMEKVTSILKNKDKSEMVEKYLECINDVTTNIDNTQLSDTLQKVRKLVEELIADMKVKKRIVRLTRIKKDEKEVNG